VAAEAKWAELAAFKVTSLPSSPAHGQVYITELGPIEQRGSMYTFRFDGGMGNQGFRFTLSGNTYLMLPLTSQVIEAESSRIIGPLVLGANLEQVSEDWLNDMEDWFKEIKLFNIVKVWKGQAPTRQTAPQNRDSTGTCSSCFDNVKLRSSGDKTLLAVHGYNRDGSGSISGRCIGTDYPPYEISRKGSEESLDFFKQQLLTSEIYKRNLEDDKIDSIDTRPGRPPIDRNDSSFSRAVSSEIVKTERLIKYYKSVVKKLNKAVSSWRPRNLPTEENLNAHWAAILASIR